MKKLIIVLIMGFAVITLAAAQVAVNGTLYVAVKTQAIKSSTGFFASTRGTLSYGDRVTVLQVNGRFVEVRSANSTLQGWAPSANFSARQIVSDNATTLSARETALAGKGFNQEVEIAYRAGNNLNYADVDRVEGVVINYETTLRQFLEQGRLSLGDN